MNPVEYAYFVKKNRDVEFFVLTKIISSKVP